MAPPPPSTSDEHAPPRRTLKSTLIAGTAALVPLGLVGLLASVHEPSTRPLPRAAPQATTSMPTRTTPDSSDVGSPDAADTAAAPPAPSFTTVPAPAPVDEPDDAASRPVPQAGRQVLRCTERGRVTYRDLQARCPEGVGEAVTVFPTQGVEKFK